MPSTTFRNRALLLALPAVALLAFLAWRGMLEPHGAKAAKKPEAVPVVVATVERRDVTHRIASIGTVQSLQTVVLRPQITGVVTEVLFAEGQRVEKGALLARIDDRAIRANLERAEAEKASRIAELRSAELDLERYRSLSDPRIVSRQTLDQQAAVVERLKAGIRAAEAAVESHRVELGYTRIVAPVRGRVGIRRVDPGNLVQAGAEGGIVTVTQVDPISVVFTVPQSVIAELEAGDARTARRVVAFDRDAGVELAQGRIESFDNQIDTATGTLRVRAHFPNPEGRLWPGQFVAVQVETGTSAASTVVPARAIGEGLNGTFVYRVADGKAQVVSVETAYRDEEIAVVTKGVSPGDSVVVDGQSRLKDGASVKIAAPVEAARARG
jgi:RND family efflux transporter MFP subunit